MVNTTEQKPTSKTRKIQGMVLPHDHDEGLIMSGSLFQSAIVLGKKTNLHAFLSANLLKFKLITSLSKKDVKFLLALQ